MINKIQTFKKGFTLVETLGAVMLLSLAIVGPLTIAQKGLQTSLIAKDQSIAFNLVQDAAEFVRFSRDTNCLVAASLTGCPAGQWVNGNGTPNTIDLASCISSDGSAACTIDTYASTVATCVSGVCPAINYDTTNNSYTYAAGASTIFNRKVQIITPSCGTICNANEAVVRVSVTWSDPVPHTITTQESILNWQ